MKNYRPLFSLIACSSLLFCSSFTSTNHFTFKTDASKSAAHQQNDAWILQSEVNGVKIYYQISSCQDTSVVYLRFDNTNTNDVKISWKEVYATKQVAEEMEGYMGQQQLVLKPGITSQSDCNKIEVAACVRFAGQLEPAYKADITSYRLQDIAVSDPS